MSVWDPEYEVIWVRGTTHWLRHQWTGKERKLRREKHSGGHGQHLGCFAASAKAPALCCRCAGQPERCTLIRLTIGRRRCDKGVAPVTRYSSAVSLSVAAR